jgi:uncharacterized membrane protein YgcG
MATTVRVLVVAIALLILFGGFVAVVVGQVVQGIWAMLLGAAGLVAIAFERARYRSEAAERGSDSVGPGGGESSVPGPPFHATEELFVDPTSGRRMRVYVNADTGERRYHAEG